MAICPQTVHRFGASSPRILHRLGRVLYTVPAGLSTENQGLSTVSRIGNPTYPQDVHMKNLLKLEEFFLFGLALFLFSKLDYGWGASRYALWFFAPDLPATSAQGQV